MRKVLTPRAPVAPAATAEEPSAQELVKFIVPFEQAMTRAPQHLFRQAWEKVHRGISVAIAFKDGTWYILEDGPKIIATQKEE